MRTEKLKDKKWIIDIVGIGSVLLFVMVVLLHVYSGELCIRYKDATGARQFMQAAQIAQGTYEGTSVSLIAYVQALFIRMASIFVSRAKWYQVFIVSEIVLRVIEVLLFYAVVRNMGKTVLRRSVAPILTILYFGGYPAISILWGNYDYWNGNAILVLLFLLLMEVAERKWGDTFVRIGKKKVSARRLEIGIALLFFLIYYFLFWNQTITNELEQTVLAGMFRNIYGDVIFFVPVLVFVVSHFCMKKGGSIAITVSGIALTLAAIFLYVQWYQGDVDGYYYYLNQYNVWLIGWVLVAAAIQIAAETKQLPAAVSYTGMYLMILALTLGGFDQHMWNHNPNYNNAYSTTNLCAVYRQALESLFADYGKYEYDADLLENYASVLNFEDEVGEIAILTSDEATQYWFDGVTGSHSEEYRLDKYEFPDIVRKLEEQDVDILAVVPDLTADKEQLEGYSDYFEMTEVTEKNGMLICETTDNRWTDVSAMIDGYDDAKQELFEMVSADGEYAGALLMADKSAYLDYIMYENITGKNMESFYTWHYSAVDNIKNLNEHGIHYIVLLYDDAYYLNTQTYFAMQNVAFENEAGCILTHSGDLWATSY